MLLHWLLLFLLFESIHLGTSRTITDNEKELHRRNSKVLFGALIGDTATIRMGLHEGGSTSAEMDPYLGEVILKLGNSYFDFPICPAVHMAINFGKREHLEAAYFLASWGADVNAFKLPSLDTSNRSYFERGYPPAMLFGLGMGQPPQSSHATILQRLHTSNPLLFNKTTIEHWRTITGNPPLLHMTVLNNFFDGSYVLVNDLGYSVHETDSHGVTPLHVAAWAGDPFTISFLIHRGADRMARDKHGRTPLHYAAARGHKAAIEMMFENIKQETRREITSLSRGMLAAKDQSGLTPLMTAALAPAVMQSIRAIRTQMTRLKIRVHERWVKSPKFVRREYEEHVMDELASDSDRTSNTCANQGDEGCISNRDVANSQWQPPSKEFLSSAARRTMSEVDIIENKDFLKKNFRERHFSTQRPLLVTGSPSTGQPIWAYRGRAEFVARYGQLRVQSGARLYAESADHWALPPLQQSSVRDWLALAVLHSDHGDSASHAADAPLPAARDPALTIDADLLEDEIDSLSPEETSSTTSSSSSSSSTESSFATSTDTTSDLTGPWVAHTQSSEDLNKFFSSSSVLSAQSELDSHMLSDLARPEQLNLCGKNDTEPYHMELGCPGSGVPLQAHNASWQVLLFGMKTWYLMAPGVQSNVTEIFSTFQNNRRAHLLLQQERGDPVREYPRVMHPVTWQSKVLPLLRAKGLVAEVLQQPGDLLFIPHHWLYVSVNHGDTALISQEFCTFRHSDNRIQPLGSVIYGGTDPHRGLGRFNTLKPFVTASDALERNQGMKAEGTPVFDLFEV